MEANMKSKCLAWTIAMTLFVMAAIPLRMAAQEQTENKQEKPKHHPYRLIDIGTFGGPESFINGSVNGGPDISRRGTVVGASATSIPTSPHSNPVGVCGGLDGTVPFVFHAFKWQDGDVTDLGALPPAATNCSNAQAVNARGEIVGNSENGIIDPVTGINEFRAVIWKGDEIEELGTFGGNVSQTSQINERGQAAGFAQNTIPDPFSIYYFQFFGSSGGTQTHAFLWEKGHLQDLGTLGGPDAAASFVNNRGQVAGASYTNSTPNAITTIPTEDPFLWENGKMIDLGSLGGTLGFPNALNNRGQVVGQSNLVGDQPGNFDPFLWDGEKLIDLFTTSVGGNPLTANAINDAGEVVGTALFPNQTAPHAYLWKNGVVKDLGTVNGDCFSEAFAINSRGQVVGQSFSCVTQLGRTFLWENGTMIDLNTFVPPSSGLQLVEAVAINDRGEIAGDLVPPDCGGGIVPTQGNDAKCGHAFVLAPCEEDNADEKGCEFDSAEARAEAEVPLNPTAQTPPAAGSQVKLSPDELVARYRSLTTKRHRRFPTFSPK
jgi:probable HAF family extracellular repeat protein